MLELNRSPTFMEQERGTYQRVGEGWQLVGRYRNQWVLNDRCLGNVHWASQGNVALTWRLLEKNEIFWCFIAA